MRQHWLHTKWFFRALYHYLRGKEEGFEVRYAFRRWIDDYCSPFRQFGYGCQNLWHYLPLIWRDRDWDYTYMLALWEKKFERMADLHKKYGHHVGTEVTVKQLRMARLLCRRIQAQNYTRIPREHHAARWGRPTLSSKPCKENSRLHELELGYTNPLTATELAQADWESSQIHKYGEYMLEQDIRLLTELVQKYIRHWWD